MHVAGILLLGLLRLGLVRLLPLLPLFRLVSIVFFAFCGFVMRSLVLSAVSFSVSPSFSSAMTIAWVVSSSSSFLRHHLHHVFLHEPYSTVTAILFIIVFHTILSILFVHVCPRCPAPCAVDLCLWAQITWRFSSSCVGWFPGGGMHPSAELAGPSGRNRALAK